MHMDDSDDYHRSHWYNCRYEHNMYIGTIKVRKDLT